MADTAVKRPVKKKLARKKVRPKQDGIKSLLDKVVRVEIGSIKMHPDNPREGDVEGIAESLDENGQYRPLVVQTDTKYILAGNHTWLGMRQLGWKYADVVFVDVDEDEAKKILLADNKLGQAGGFNDELLARIMSGLADVRGTGYDQSEVNDIIERNRVSLSETVDDVEDRIATERAAIKEAKESKSFERLPLGEEDAVDTIGGDEDEEEEAPPGRLEKAADDLKGAFQLKPDLAFSKEDAVGIWQLPRVRSDMLMTYAELPENIRAWAGSATKDWPDEDQWWLYNFGIDSTSGMRDPSKMIISFYAFDQYFENWWFYPDKYVTKLLNTGIKYAVMPDFSMHSPGEESRVLSLWNLYRNRWLARYMQEAGIKIVPNVTWATADEEFLTKYIIPTMPKNIPLLSLQIQTVDEKHPMHKDYIRQLQYVLDKLNPEALMLYYGAQGKRLFDSGEVTFSGPIRFIASRQQALSEVAKKKTKKKTL
jgi:ParB-like chromosome segregation protein Spo0J